jgi:alpha-beta hydrolase superfamily lysophospholipase
LATLTHVRRALIGVVAAALLCAPGAVAGSFTKTDGMFTADDGVQLAYTFYEPTTGMAPAGFPAIMMFHGLGGKRQDMNQIAEQSFANEGYAVLTFDARGHGQSGGFFSADGPRELADLRELFDWLAVKNDVDGKHIGAWGISLGGGAVWASVASGIPFAAGEVVETWTDLYSALVPQDLSKSGLLFGFLSSVPADRTSPDVLAVKQPALSSTNLPVLRAFAAARSSRGRLSSVTTPMFMFQGRRDYAFDIDQAWQAFTRLKGPKRLYIGDFGHPPSTFPGPDVSVVLAEGADWFDHFLKGAQNGIDKRPPLELAAQPFAEAGAHSYAGLPPTKALQWTLRGSSTLVGNNAVSRPVHLPKSLVETFGAPAVRVTVSGSFPHLLATLNARLPDGTQEVVSEGGIALTPTSKPHTVTIRLLAFATTLPAGTRLSLTFAPVTTGSNVVYLLSSVVNDARITIGKAVLTMPVLKTPISS